MSLTTIPAPLVIAKRIPGNKYKSTLDCVVGYNGIEVAGEDRQKTTFAAKWGKFRYRRAPQGYLSSGDSYSRYTDTILEDCPSTPANKDFEKIVNDVITWSNTVEGAFLRICSMLSHCNKKGLVFNPDKFRFARREVEWDQVCRQVHGYHQRLPHTQQHLRSEIVVWDGDQGHVLLLQD